jgi:hypothetical protein
MAPMRVILTRIRVLAALVTTAAILVACGGAAAPTGEPSLRGVVTTVSPSADGSGGALRVVWTSGPGVGTRAEYDAADVTVTEKTAVFKRDSASGDRLQKIEFGEIVVGDIVEAWFTGAVAESYPVQATASTVVVQSTRFGGTLPTPPGLEPEPAP